jgi:hypothetical protein
LGGVGRIDCAHENNPTHVVVTNLGAILCVGKVPGGTTIGMKSLKGKVAAITGAASGIGQALAVVLAVEGCHLALERPLQHLEVRHCGPLGHLDPGSRG